MSRAARSASLKSLRASLVYSERSFYDAAINAVSVTIEDDSPDAATTDVENKQMICLAERFLKQTCPDLLRVLYDNSSCLYDKDSINDRLIKIGRNVKSTVDYFGENKETADTSLALLADECMVLAHILQPSDDEDENVQIADPNTAVTETLHKQVPKVRFGKTELQMPILTLGCMRFQQSWNRGGSDNVNSMDGVSKDCQSNLVQILKYAIRMGVTHIETAKAYGSSEMQLGDALSLLFSEGIVKRQDLIIQSKAGISSGTTPDELCAQVEHSLKTLRLDYLDLFSLHGLNTMDHYEWVFNHGDQGSLIDAVYKLKKAGKIRYIGFSTHAPVNVTRKLIETEKFDYVNLHYHWCGSYTCSGEGECGGNLENIKLCAEKDMGVFIISAFDKGGRLYAPSNLLRSLTLPDLEPINYGALWLWHHERYDASAPIHTIVCGAARPSDLDQPILAALTKDLPEVIERVENVTQRLQRAMDESFSSAWTKTWHMGLPNYQESKCATQLGNIVWLSNLIQAYGMVDFARERYSPLAANLKKYDRSKSKEENVVAMGPFWGWAPGIAADPDWDYSEDLANCPVENLDIVKEAIKVVYETCGTKTSGEKKAIPVEWETAFDLRPWVAFPERAPAPW
mmetsp:Transcript_695/g.1015  ORF Transcript_695/g.1015 Transcript_695/m.1015 type:complete len:628 (-) Transcript_695:413-2296(-)|eukprot:CAMPEP_0172419312 /NCGR_PEP_ID=MMETSP1064-20121228/5740_1 /TAXON_ID=202472 /ORGANISM="Aulacoseira subarctica , Strain CCAP 1002/5" /LENGTH=627 /DNA_ID=CAMNT_0013158731 /DNA_START=78 /DNA_END=1958 /DNA_ORIENTATION=+